MHKAMTDAACAAEEYVPGANQFIRQLFRAKAEFLKGVAALVNAEVEQIEKMDAAFDNPPATASGEADCSGKAEKIPVE